MIDQAYSQAGIRWFSVTKRKTIGPISIGVNISSRCVCVCCVCMRIMYGAHLCLFHSYPSPSYTATHTRYDHLKRSSINFIRIYTLRYMVNAIVTSSIYLFNLFKLYGEYSNCIPFYSLRFFIHILHNNTIQRKQEYALVSLTVCILCSFSTSYRCPLSSFAPFLSQ